MIYAHEHITIDLSGVKEDRDCCLDDRETVLKELKALENLGVGFVVDQTNRGMGRDTLYAQSVADEAGLGVLHATGYYKEPFLPDECYILTEEDLCKVMLDELLVGVGQTGIRASFIGEIGTSGDCVRPVEEKIFRAAGRAHAETGCPICTHTTLGALGMEQLAILREYCVDLSKVVLSHIDLSGDVDYMFRLLETGVNIAFDTVGKENYQSDSDRVAWLTELCRKGYAGQIVMSVDITRKSHYKVNGGHGYAHLAETFIPLLRDAGCEARDIEAMLTDNPARIYGIRMAN
jgi:phosphotriesterase-related protein